MNDDEGKPQGKQAIEAAADPESPALISGIYVYGNLTFFEIHVKRDNFNWKIYRRYNWFRALYTKLQTSKGIKDIPFPEKHWIRNTNEGVLLERKQGLQAFLDSICSDTKLFNNKYVIFFMYPIRQCGYIEIPNKQLFKQKTSFYFVDEVLDTYPEVKGRAFYHHSVEDSRDIFTGVSFIENIDEEKMALWQYLQSLTNKKVLSSWEKCLQKNLSKRIVHIQRQMVRLVLAPSSSASTDISGDEKSEDEWEIISRRETKKNSMILQDAEIDVIVAAEQAMDDNIIAGQEDGIDSDELSL